MDINYILGVKTSIEISIVIGIIAFISYSGFSIIGNKETNMFRIIIYLLISLITSFGFTACIFLFIYNILNILLQDFLNIEFYNLSFQKGTLMLRISSLLLAFNCLKSLILTLSDGEQLRKTREKLTEKDSPIDSINITLSNLGISKILVTQNIIYIINIFLLWIFILYNENLFYSLIQFKIAIWALFFITDDWIIISDNILALKGAILKKHKIRIWVFNILISLTTIIAYYIELENKLYSIILGLILLFTIILNMISYDKKYDFTYSTNSK